LEDAKEVGNIECAEQAEEEIDSLTAELSRAVGLRGRDRRAGSASERARQSIKKSIKSAMKRIEQSDAALGNIFSRCVKTGFFCRYQPCQLPDRFNGPLSYQPGLTGVKREGSDGLASDPSKQGISLQRVYHRPHVER
jgi:hypothetical protein